MSKRNTTPKADPEEPDADDTLTKKAKAAADVMTGIPSLSTDAAPVADDKDVAMITFGNALDTMKSVCDSFPTNMADVSKVAQAGVDSIVRVVHTLKGLAQENKQLKQQLADNKTKTE